MTEQALAFELRRLKPSDIPEILAVYQACEDFLALGPNAKASEAMVRQDTAHLREVGGQFCGIFNSEGIMQGIVDFVAQGYEGNPRFAFLELLMIAKPYRGKGLGAAVVKQVEAEIKRQNPAAVWIYSAVQVNNPLALKFWQAHGYSTATHGEQQADGTTTYLLQKDLR